jgi:hypothetical protein
LGRFHESLEFTLDRLREAELLQREDAVLRVQQTERERFAEAGGNRRHADVDRPSRLPGMCTARPAERS